MTEVGIAFLLGMVAMIFIAVATVTLTLNKIERDNKKLREELR